MRSRRALLYMPGDDWRKIAKAAALEVDCVCMDMEDGTAFNRKVEARSTIARALQELDFGRSEKLARINGVGTGLEQQDLWAVLPYHPDGIVLPKCESAEQLNWLDAEMEKAELRFGWPLRSLRVLAIVETALGILNLREIAPHPRLDALIFGGEDFAASVGATRTAEAEELLYARLALVTACGAYGLQALDIVTIEFRDRDFVYAQALRGAGFGFSGKQIIHPAQIEPAQSAFTPSNESIAYAQRVVSTFETHQGDGKGAYELDGKMIDLPLLKNAEKVLERARAAGKI